MTGVSRFALSTVFTSLHFRSVPYGMKRFGVELLEGYRQFGTLEFSEVYLIEALRATRMLHHAAWIAERWADPAFPRAFPWAAEARFWEGYVGDLQEQCSLLEDPPLQALLASTGPGS